MLLCLYVQLQRQLSSAHIKWIASQSFLLTSLSAFAVQFDSLYGEQFQNSDGFPKELLAEEFVAEKLVEFWACLNSVWCAAVSQADGELVCVAILRAVSQMLPIVSALLTGTELADAAMPLFHSITKTLTTQHHASGAKPRPALPPPVVPAAPAVDALMFSSPRMDVAAVSPMVSAQTPGPAARSTSKWAVIRDAVPAVEAAAAPLERPSVASIVMAKRRAMLGNIGSHSSARAPMSKRAEEPATAPQEPIVSKLPDHRAALTEYVLATLAAVYRSKDVASDSSVMLELQTALFPSCVTLLAASAASFVSIHSSSAEPTDYKAVEADATLSIRSDLFPGIQALLSALCEDYLTSTLTAVSQGMRTYMFCDL